MYEESFNTVLLQEAERYNSLLEIVQSTLQDLLKALRGFVVMSEQLEVMATSLFNNKIPANWRSKSYLSSKSLGRKSIYNKIYLDQSIYNSLRLIPKASCYKLYFLLR